MSSSNIIDDLMINPINLQFKMIEDLESRLLGGNAIITDPNSVAVHLIESFSSVTAGYAHATQRALERRLPLRAQSDEDLFLHMHDYDTVGSFATPSKATIALFVDRDNILRKGALVNNSYRCVKIPLDTIVTLGTIPFGLYYPVLIQVDERTKIPLVTYDISEQNPLHRLESNRVVFNEYKYNGFNLIVMYLTVYQFTKTSKTVPVDGDIGFSQTYEYLDKFYAVRIFTDSRGKRIELGQSMVQDNYDASYPTSRVQVMQDTKKFLVNIPQVYFTNGLIGPRLYIDLYTTKGNISANVGAMPPDQVQINFNLDGKPSDPYTDPMRYKPTLFANITSPKTTDGSDGYTYEERRKRVVNTSFRTNAQITPIDIKNYYADYGIKVERYEDNLTNLMYFVYKVFTDASNEIVPSTATYLEIDKNTHNETSFVKAQPDGTISILPPTWFRYRDSHNSCVPLTDEDLRLLLEMDKATLAAEYNENSYVRTPFHIRLVTSATYPYATSYNLLQPKIEKMTVTDENPESLAQMISVAEEVTHLKQGSGGYRVRLIVKKDLMDAVLEDDIVVWVYTYSTDKQTVGARATYAGLADGLAVYEVEIGTSYWINADDEIEVTTLQTDTVETQVKSKIALESTFYIVYMCKDTYFGGVDTPLHLYGGVPAQYRNNTVLLRQSMVLHLGHRLDDVLYTGVNPVWEKQQYRRHQVDIYETYGSDVYATNEQGVPVMVTDSEGKHHLVLEHNKGDVVIGDDGQPVIKFSKGDLYLGTDGAPVLEAQRSNKYLISAPVFDGKIFVSDHPTQKAFVENLPATFETYFDIIRNTRGYVTERTLVYFKPSKTMGSAKFKTGNGVKVTMDLDLQFTFKLHVEPVVSTDPDIKTSITETSIGIVEELLQEDIISQTTMAKTIANNIQFVYSVDALGINGQRDMQSLQVEDDGGHPSIKKRLSVSEDNLLVMTKDIFIDYVDVR